MIKTGRSDRPWEWECGVCNHRYLKEEYPMITRGHVECPKCKTKHEIPAEWITKFPPDPEDLLNKAPTVGDYTEYDRYLKLLAEAQRYKLRLKAHRGWIGNVPVEKLFALLRKEVDELEEAMKRNNHFEMIMEGADIANYALGIMIAVMEGKKPDGV